MSSSVVVVSGVALLQFVPSEATDALESFLAGGRYGNITLHFQAGRIRGVEVKESLRVTECHNCHRVKRNGEKGWQVQARKPVCPSCVRGCS